MKPTPVVRFILAIYLLFNTINKFIKNGLANTSDDLVFYVITEITPVIMVLAFILYNLAQGMRELKGTNIHAFFLICFALIYNIFNIFFMGIVIIQVDGIHITYITITTLTIVTMAYLFYRDLLILTKP